MSEKIFVDLHINHLKNKNCNRLSGGEMQMVYIAKALVSQPRLLIFDEPESNLDFYNQAQLLKILQTLAKSHHTAIIINSHYIQNIIRFSTWRPRSFPAGSPFAAGKKYRLSGHAHPAYNSPARKNPAA